MTSAELIIERKLQIDYRVVEQQAKASIKNNPVLALVELVTNSDDSYRRLESNGFKVDGRIAITLIRKYSGSIIRVMDYAEGFDGPRMDERVGGFGGDTSGFTEKKAGRGYWGRGLKEAMIAMGSGTVESIRDGFFYKCTLDQSDYRRDTRPIRVTKDLRDAWGIRENGTLITLRIVNEGIRIPQYESLRHNLEYYYSLRDIMSSGSREVQLVEEDSRGRERRQDRLSYIFPKGDLCIQKQIPLPGFNNSAVELEIYRATEPLSGIDDEGPLRENGLLICSRGAIVDITLTAKFERNNYASRIFGHATCDYIDYLMRTEREPIIRSDRVGIDWSHSFAKVLDQIISKEVALLVLEEEKKAKETEKRLESEKTRKRYESSLPELNKIAKEELGEDEGTGGGEGPGRPQKMPPNGFDFMPDYSQIVVDNESTLTLKALVPKVVSSGSVVKITSDTEEIVPVTRELVLDEKDANPDSGLIISHVRVVGRQVGAEGIVTAETNGLKAEMIVKVISRKPPPPPPPDGRSGLISGFDFSPVADPHQRVKFDRGTGKVIIATHSPSVEIYFGPNGEGQEEGHCQVMLAELVIEAVCREVARRRIESGKEIFPGEVSEAMNVVHNRLINKYAEKIHSLLVEKRFRK